MTERPRFQVRNSLGRLIIDVTDRNMEALTWGSVNIGGSGDVQRIEWPLVDCPIVFMKSVPSSWMFRSRIVPGVGGEFGTVLNVSAHQACRIDYVVGGFRRADEFVGKEGLFMRDVRGRIGFDSGRRYIRLTNPPPGMYTAPPLASEPDWRQWFAGTWTHGPVTVPAHPNWTPNTYFHWRPNWAYGDTVSNNWYQGFGAVDASVLIEIRRFSIGKHMTDTFGIGAFQPLNPGNMSPFLSLTCEFAP